MTTSPTLVDHERQVLRDFDPDAFLEVIAGGRFEHDLLHARSLTASLERTAGADIVVDRGWYGFETVVRGDFRPGWLCFGLVDCRDGGTRINGRRIDRGDIQYYAEGGELLYRSGPDTHWAAVQVTRSALQEAAQERWGRVLDLPHAASLNITPAPGAADRIRRCIDSVSREAEGGRATADGVQAVLDVLAQALLEMQGGVDDATGRPFRDQRCVVVRRAMEEMLRHAPSAYDSARLCAAVGVSERVLQAAFRQALGLSPSHWFSCMRLTAVRRTLLNGPSSRGAVTAAAMGAGFTHLGRFSTSYKAAFDETPTETLRRVAGA